MIEKGRISAMQMGILIYPTIMATAILLVPAISHKYAEQDMWLSPIWASFAGFISVILAVQLNRRFPELTFIQYTEKIIGRILGKLIGFAYVLFLFHINGLIVREYSEFVVGNFLPNTPLTIVLVSMVLVCAFAVRGGLEVMARSAQIFVPIVIFLFVGLLILLISELEPGYLLPFLEKGMGRSLMGAIVPASWFLEFFLISFMLPFLSDRKKGMKSGMVTVIIVALTMVVTNLITMFLFGNLTDRFTYPVMEAIRYISVADFFEHLESIVMAIWVAGTFVKIAVFYYAIAIGTAQLLNLSDYRPIIFPIGFLLVLMGIWSASTLQELESFLSTIFPFYAIVFFTLLPTILLILAIIRKKSEKPTNPTK
ncbi:GerAB/ArcD/ProY family transporter [Oceanobacillus senegalensis]|uniref:GerAB/ArcD/ProY family transporter n=1 Tax=Oceanobacillus senegalensis TaxID=1936063 RepID=UPI0015C40EB2|nr:endospore germination permease [Oceanobacillus senegalensis]